MEKKTYVGEKKHTTNSKNGMPSCIERKGHFEMREYFAEFMTKTARQPVSQPAIEPNYVCTKTKINNRGERKKP